MTLNSSNPSPAETGNKKATGLKYVMITPARNEEASIEKTIESMVRQTVLPVKWVIVSDGSTDNTDEIARFGII